MDLHPDLDAKACSKIIGDSLKLDFPLETGVSKDGSLNVVRLIPYHQEISRSEIKQGDVILATGGARGITAECLKHLAKQESLTFVIFGRTTLSSFAEKLAGYSDSDWSKQKSRIIERLKRDGSPLSPTSVERELLSLKHEAEVFKTIRELKELGSEVIYRDLDIRDAKSVESALSEVAQTCGRVDLVIHGAGIDISKSLRSKTIEQMENVISVKVDGMLSILRGLDSQGIPPRRVIGFGSVSGRFGNMAQVDYSAGNDGLAHLARWASSNMDIKVSVIDWAPWAEIGMATRESIQKTLEKAGIDFITPETGVEILSREVGRMSSCSEMVAAGRLGPFSHDAFNVNGSKVGQSVELVGDLGWITSHLPGQYLKINLTLDPSRPLLDHHRIDRAAVLPGVAGMQIMLSAARILEPQKEISCFRDVKFLAPVKIFHQRPHKIEVEALRVVQSDDGRECFKAAIYSWFIDKDGRRMGARRLHHECRLTFGTDEEVPVNDFPEYPDSVWALKEDIYSVFFHGPAFRLLDHLVVQGQGNLARFGYCDSEERSRLFPDYVAGSVEAVFQASAGWSIESNSVMSLPIGINRVRIIDPFSRPSEGIITPSGNTFSKTHSGRKLFNFDGVIMDSAGKVTIALEGVQMVELASTQKFSNRFFEQIVNTADIVKEVEMTGEMFLSQNLVPQEIEEYSSKTVEKRARDWITGRMALKMSIQRMFAGSQEEIVNLNSIHVKQNGGGKPLAEIVSEEASRPLGELSISHSNGLAIAHASFPGRLVGLGVDVEKIEERPEAWVDDYFDEREIALARTKGSLWTELTKFWSLKEAFLKAVGTGLRCDLKDLRIVNLDDSGKAQFEFRNDLEKQAGCFSNGEIWARVEEKRGMIVARVAILKQIKGVNATEN